MSKTKLTIDTSEERIIAAARFQAGDRVRHIPSDKPGTFMETHNGFALPECWVNFDSITAASGFIPRSCNPLELEKLHVEPGVSQQLELGYDIQPTYKPIGTTSQIEKPACPDNCQDIINVDSCQDPQKWFSNQNQNLQQPIGSYINKDLVVNRLLKPTELPAALSGNCSKITATSSETKSSCLSLCSTELNTLSGSQATITPEQIKDEHTSIETSGNITTGKFQKDGMCITSTEISKTIELKIFSASRQETTQGCTSLSKNTDLNSDRDLITLEQSGDWTQGKSTHLLKLPVEQLAETEAQLRKPSKTGEGQQERIGSGYKCSNLKHSASFQELGDSTYQRENLELEQPSSLKSIPSANKFSKGTFRASLFTGMSAPLTQRKENGKLCMGGHPAKIFLAPTQAEEDSTVIAPGSGGKCSELSESPDLDLLSGKMSDLPDTQSRENPTALLPELLGVLPTSGTYANGHLSAQPTLARPTVEKGCSLLPTPMSYSKGSGKRRPGQTKLDQRLRALGHIKPEEVLNPEVPLWMMGFPAGWLLIEPPDGGQQMADQPELEFYEEVKPKDMNSLNVLEMPLCPESPRSPSVESSTLIPNSSESGVGVDVRATDLTDLELTDRHRLELAVERAFVEAGLALRELRDRRLYRDSHKTFEEYCRDRFRFQRSHSYQLIDAAGVVENLSANGGQKLPTNERQVRPLTALNPEEQREVWQQAVEEAGGKLPSGRIVKGIVERLKQRDVTPPPVPYSPGDVVMIRGAGNPELRKYDGQWAIALRINEYSVTVSLDGKDMPVSPKFLEEVDRKDWDEIKAIHNRIDRLSQCELDPMDDAALEVLKRRTYFTDRQKQALATLENVYLNFP